MQCQNITKIGIKCKRSITTGTHCWQHGGEESESEDEIELENKLDLDTELLMYSYLPLEEILTIFEDDITTRNQIIQRYFKKLPDLYQASERGQIATVKYLISLGIKPNKSTLD